MPMSTLDSEQAVSPEQIASEVRDLLPLLITISKMTWLILNLRLAEFGLNHGQEEVLQAIDAFRPSTAVELARRIGVRIPTIAGILDHLIKRGLVERQQDHRGRADQQIILITPAGSETRRQLDRMRQDLEGELVGSMTADDLHRMKRELASAERQLGRQAADLR